MWQTKKHVTTRSKPLAQRRLSEKEIRRQKRNGVKRKDVQGVLARYLGNSHRYITGKAQKDSAEEKISR